MQGKVLCRWRWPAGHQKPGGGVAGAGERGPGTLQVLGTVGHTGSAGWSRGEGWGRAQKSTRPRACPCSWAPCLMVAPAPDGQRLKPELAILGSLGPFAPTPLTSGRPRLPVLTLVAVISEISFPTTPGPCRDPHGEASLARGLCAPCTLAQRRVPRAERASESPEGLSKHRRLGPLCCLRVCTSNKFAGDAVMVVQGPR